MPRCRAQPTQRRVARHAGELMLTRARPMLHVFCEDRRGVVAVEFAGAAMFLVLGLLNAVDVGYYTYQRMEVENAAQVGAQTAWKPVTTRPTCCRRHKIALD